MDVAEEYDYDYVAEGLVEEIYERIVFSPEWFEDGDVPVELENSAKIDGWFDVWTDELARAIEKGVKSGKIKVDDDYRKFLKNIKGSEVRGKISKARSELNGILDGEEMDESRNLRGRTLNEGPGAGYEIYVRNMEIVDDPEIKINVNGNVKISADVKFYADAYGYDWSTESVAKYVGDDALEGPYTGTIEFEIPNEGDNLKYAKDEFYKGKTFEEMKTWYGGGWFFVPFKGYLDMVLYYEDTWEIFLEHGGKNTNGTLSFSDDAFSKFVSFSHDFEYRCYRLREEVQAYLEKNGLVCDWSDEYLEEFVASWVDDTDEISDSTIEEIVDEMKDRDAVYDPDWNDLEKKNESE